MDIEHFFSLRYDNLTPRKRGVFNYFYNFPAFNLRCNSFITSDGLLNLPSTIVPRYSCNARIVNGPKNPSTTKFAPFSFKNRCNAFMTNDGLLMTPSIIVPK